MLLSVTDVEGCMLLPISTYSWAGRMHRSVEIDHSSVFQCDFGFDGLALLQGGGARTSGASMDSSSPVGAG